MNFKLVLAEPLDNSLGSHVETFLKHHGGPGLQHIGLTTDKATETVQIMLDKGAQFRKPPPTYYQLVILPQCGNFRIFLSFRFYVKSLLENVEVLKGL